MNYIEKAILKQTGKDNLSDVNMNVINAVNNMLQNNLKYNGYNTLISDTGNTVQVRYSTREQTYCSSGADVEQLESRKYKKEKHWSEYKSDTIRELLDELEYTTDINEIQKIEIEGEKEAARILANWRLAGLTCSRNKRAKDFMQKVILNLSKVKDLSNARFITFTFDPETEGARYPRLNELNGLDLSDPSVITKCFLDTIKRMNRQRSYNYKYSYVIEWTSEGTCHLHAIFYNFNKDTLDMTVINNWGYGYVDIEKLYNKKKKDVVDSKTSQDIIDSLTHYLGKTLGGYVTKSLTAKPEDWKGKRISSHSRDCYNVNKNRILYQDIEFLNDIKRMSRDFEDSYSYDQIDYELVYSSGVDIAWVEHGIRNKDEAIISEYTYKVYTLNINKDQWRKICKQHNVIAFAPATDSRNVKARRQSQLEDFIYEQAYRLRLQMASLKLMRESSKRVTPQQEVVDLVLDPNFESDTYMPEFKKLVSDNGIYYATYGYFESKGYNV